MDNKKKSKNVPHSGSPTWITTGHNKSDKEFLKGNSEALRKLQRNIT